jgi:hypothetical protein
MPAEEPQRSAEAARRILAISPIGTDTNAAPLRGDPTDLGLVRREVFGAAAIERAGSDHRAFSVFEDRARYKVS